MIKPRIIIADADQSYVAPLQQKLIEEYFEKIDLEIISDNEYFNVFLSSPQKADIFIVSEELYTPAIQRHNFKNVFLMTEQDSAYPNLDSSIKPLYKYSSTKEILSTIFGSSSVSLRFSSGTANTPQIVLVYSACGGVGKTTVSLGISAALSKNYKRILYIDAAHLQAFSPMITNKGPIMESDVYVNLSKPSDNIYSEIKHVIRNEGFCYVPPFKAALLSIGLPYSIFEKLALSAKSSDEYDYIVIDADTAFDEDKIRLIDIADKVIIVTKQNSASVHATSILMSNLNRVNAGKYIFLCNDFVQEDPNAIIGTSAVTVSEYIQHLPHYDQLKASDLANNDAMQKVGFLVM